MVVEARGRGEEREDGIEEDSKAEEVQIEWKTPQSDLRDRRWKKVLAARKKIYDYYDK